MLELRLGNTDEEIIVTLNELKTLNEPNYLFIFTHILTKREVSFVKLQTDDLSDYPERYNRFLINTATIFNNEPPGEWLYRVYEQESEDNLDPDNATGIVENGKMLLSRAIDFSFEKYDEPVTFKTYNG
jgi:hypothetical protein